MGTASSLSALFFEEKFMLLDLSGEKCLEQTIVLSVTLWSFLGVTGCLLTLLYLYEMTKKRYKKIVSRSGQSFVLS